ncbi:hypothetical protein Dsin_025738 [Dipteronia sinensis]|uniref:Cytochrome P450 n=1 Tax=Dipteronia sinensis TaxID=43782 RepID=A0AAD9ZXZ2_9ROSI|nr:hypothetical protein Dsin_025738 [Dipteronia sinensis]
MATLCIISILEEWENQANASEDRCKTMELSGEFKRLNADIIANAAFGSSYMEGGEAFKAQEKLQEFAAAASLQAQIFIPGRQYLPTPSNIQMWKLDRKVKNTIRNIIESRLNDKATGSSDDYGDDLLGGMIGASEMVQSKPVSELNIDEIIDECKTYFFARHETTTFFLTWIVFLLCVHPEWQSKLREEVLREYSSTGIPNADMLTKLKSVNMVLLETMRLYGPITELPRVATGDVKLGNITIPKDTHISIPLMKIYRSKKNIGEKMQKNLIHRDSLMGSLKQRNTQMLLLPSDSVQELA